MRAGTGRTYLVLLALAVLDSTAYSVIGPVLPALSASTGASTTVLGWLTASFPVAMLGGFVLAVPLRRRSTRTPFLVAIGLLVLGSLGFVGSEQLAVLFPARMVMGLGSGVLWIAVTLSTLEYWPGSEYVRMSRVYGAYSVGALLGPLLGALPGSHRPFVGYALLLLLAVPLVWTMPSAPVRVASVTDWSALRLRGFWFSALAIMFAMLAFGLLDGVLPLHFGSELTQTQIGFTYAATALLVAVAATGSSRLRPVVALWLGGVGVVVGVGAAGLSSQVAVWFGALALVGLGAGASETGATGALLEAVPTERIATAMVVWSQVAILGYVVAPAVGAPLADAAGFGAVGLVPLAVGLLVVVVGAVSAARGRRTPSAPADLVAAAPAAGGNSRARAAVDPPPSRP
jgi:MFS family permease